jgi:ABC-type microcin C transport system duplicated ATPase subunit YejF
MTGTPILSVQGLTKRFPLRKGLFARAWKDAVDNVSFDISRGETLALVGESGSGKSTVGLMLLDLLAPTAGQVLFNGQPVTNRRGSERLAFRRQMQVVFQDPYASLNARLTVRETLTEGLIIHRIGSTARERESIVQELLADVNLPAEALDRYPHEFSGGQRQRIAIARALSVSPAFIVLDEPTSALDASVQSQVLNLLRKLQSKRDLTYLLITHNFDVVAYMADNVAVMKSGRIVERGSVEDIFDRPREDYTQQLLSAIPRFESAQSR